MHANKKLSLVLAIAVMLFPTLVMAATPGSGDTGGNYNTMLISLVTLMLVLLLVIAMLGNTLRMLSFAVRDKIRKDRQSSSTTVKAILLAMAVLLPSVHALAADAVKTAAPVSDFINGMHSGDFYSIMSVIILEIVVIFTLVIYMRQLLNVIRGKAETAPGEKTAPKHNWFWDKFNAAAPLEQEKDILMDHNYDGIQELDNSLPPWWKYGFYLTIVVAVIYMYRYHVSHDGPSSKQEYEAAMQQAADEKAEYLKQAGNNIDENNVTRLTDPGEIAAGKEIFVKTCSPCHVADGGGNVGPNLTDDYWLHGGSIKDVFKSIKYGWQDKGMKSWKDDFTPKQIQELASFVKSLRGTHPAVPKAAQGELYIEAASATDSSKVKTDTTKTATK